MPWQSALRRGSIYSTLVRGCDSVVTCGDLELGLSRGHRGDVVAGDGDEESREGLEDGLYLTGESLAVERGEHGPDDPSEGYEDGCDEWQADSRSMELLLVDG